jgi:hypothetical protein
MVHVEDLELVLPRLTPSRWARLLRHLSFSHLELFRTNAPHAVVTEFLECHQSIAYLSLETCGRKLCPLDGSRLHSLRDISGPIACLTTLIQNNPISRMTAHQNVAADPLPPSSLMRSLATRKIDVTVLELELSPRDFDTLWCIACSIPALTALKLIEIQLPAAVSHFLATLYFVY